MTKLARRRLRKQSNRPADMAVDALLDLEWRGPMKRRPSPYRLGFPLQFGLTLLATTLLLAGCSADESETNRVVVCGHLYSAYVRSMVEEKPAVFSDHVMRTFADEIERIDPEAVFFLGDNTRYSSHEEWETIERAFARVSAEKIFIPGNHELRGRDVFLEHGGVVNRAFIIGGSKFITLDAKDVYEEHDLAYLREELADREEYDHVFLLTHHYLVNYAPAQPDQPPYRGGFDSDFLRNSNWNTAVVPLIAGKVDYVICGDYFPENSNAIQHFEDIEVHYLLTSILFGRGLGPFVTGDGPLLFLELSFKGDELSILPRTIPLDIRDPWYRNYSIKDLPWRQCTIAEAGLTLTLPHGWTPRGGATEERTIIDGRHVWDGSQASIRIEIRGLPPGSTLVGFAADNLAELEERHPGFEFASGGPMQLDGLQASWGIAARDPRSPEPDSFIICLIRDGQGYVFHCTSMSHDRRESIKTLKKIIGSARFND